MISAETLYHIGSWTIAVLGAGHIGVDLAMRAKVGAPAIEQQMAEFQVPLPGPIQRSLRDFHIGFSMMMGVLLIAFGTLNGILVSQVGAAVAGSATFAGFNAAVCAVTFVLAYRFFFIVPVVASAVATACFAGALLV